jgi:hypothetical protein
MEGQTGMKKTLFAVLAVVVLFSSSAAAGPVMLAGFPGGGALYYPGGGTVGYEFTSNADLSVISIGIYDENADGLSESHLVRLWTEDGSLLTSATVPSGTAASYSNGYRWVTATATLKAGSSYILGADYLGNDWFRDTATIDSHFTFVNDLFFGADGYGVPDTTYFNDGKRAWFGPNLSVPDGGATLMLLGGALVGLAALRRKFRV